MRTKSKQLTDEKSLVVIVRGERAILTTERQDSMRIWIILKQISAVIVYSLLSSHALRCNYKALYANLKRRWKSGLYVELKHAEAFPTKLGQQMVPSRRGEQGAIRGYSSVRSTGQKAHEWQHVWPLLLRQAAEVSLCVLHCLYRFG